jgi:N-acetylglucosaminyldiphosphoundecaprenol N-acetyl-beta-D-mannosaminyltransferase
MPMVWVGRLQGFKEMSRVYGPDLMLEVCKLSVKNGYTHFFYGGKDGVAQQLEKNLTKRFPGLKVVGTYTPPFRPLSSHEEQELIKLVHDARPDIFWVGLGTPKQEKFMAQYLDKLDTKLMIGVGAAFDIHSGQTRQAPRWMQRSGLEWLFRLLQEPRRLWRRYLINNPLFLYRITLQFFGIKKYPLEKD